MGAGTFAASGRFDDNSRWGTEMRPDRVAMGDPDAGNARSEQAVTEDGKPWWHAFEDRMNQPEDPDL